MRYLLVLSMLLSLSSCTYGPRGEGEWVKKVNPDEASRIILTYAVSLEEDKRLHLEDSFIIHDNFIHKFHMEFITQHLLELKQARELLVDVVEGFIKRVNDNEFMRGQLREYPLSADDLEIYIYFESYYGKYIDGRLTGCVALRDGLSIFMGFDLHNQHQNWWQERSEYYWQSRDFVKYQREGEWEYFKEHQLRESKALKNDQYRP